MLLKGFILPSSVLLIRAQSISLSERKEKLYVQRYELEKN